MELYKKIFYVYRDKLLELMCKKIRLLEKLVDVNEMFELSRQIKENAKCLFHMYRTLLLELKLDALSSDVCYTKTERDGSTIFNYRGVDFTEDDSVGSSTCLRVEVPFTTIGFVSNRWCDDWDYEIDRLLDIEYLFDESVITKEDLTIRLNMIKEHIFYNF